MSSFVPSGGSNSKAMPTLTRSVPVVGSLAGTPTEEQPVAESAHRSEDEHARGDDADEHHRRLPWRRIRFVVVEVQRLRLSPRRGARPRQRRGFVVVEVEDFTRLRNGGGDYENVAATRRGARELAAAVPTVNAEALLTARARYREAGIGHGGHSTERKANRCAVRPSEGCANAITRFARPQPASGRRGGRPRQAPTQPRPRRRQGRHHSRTHRAWCAVCPTVAAATDSAGRRERRR